MSCLVNKCFTNAISLNINRSSKKDPFYKNYRHCITFMLWFQEI